MIILKRAGWDYSHNCGFSIDRTDGSGDYLFLLFKSKVTLMLGNETIYADNNSFILFKKGTPQLYFAQHEPLVNDWFHFDGEDAEELIKTLKIPFDTLLQIDNSNIISSAIKELHLEKMASAKFSPQIIDYMIRILFMKISDMYYTEKIKAGETYYYRKMLELRNEIYNSPCSNRTINELASKLNMSESYFQHIYKLTFKTSPINDVIQSKIEYSKYLLQNTSFSIVYISELCGYNNNVHFMRQFKKLVGYTPSKYRKLYK
jgi:AraC family transcriptional regulator of arabinose operon